jgi:hypothetical protein
MSCTTLYVLFLVSTVTVFVIRDLFYNYDFNSNIVIYVVKNIEIVHIAILCIHWLFLFYLLLK